jgi:hypothetical protein
MTERAAAVEAAMNRPEFAAPPTAVHVYRLAGVTETPIAVPTTVDDAAMAFRCPVLRCRIGRGIQCAQRWGVAQAGALEREKCRVCPAGSARARLLGVKPAEVDMITADRIRIVSHGTPRGDRDQEVKRVTRLRAAQRAKSEIARLNRDRRIKVLMEEAAVELAKAPAESAIELCRRILGAAATSTEQALVSDAIRGLVAAKRVARGPDRRYRLLSGEVQ